MDGPLDHSTGKGERFLAIPKGWVKDHAYDSLFLFLMRTNWVTNKQTADGFLRYSGGRPYRLAPRTGPSTLYVRIM